VLRLQCLREVIAGLILEFDLDKLFNLSALYPPVDRTNICVNGVNYVCLERLAYEHHSDGTSRKKLCHNVYLFHDGKPALFMEGHKVLRSEGEIVFIRGKLKAGLLYAIEEDAQKNHSSYWRADS